MAAAISGLEECQTLNTIDTEIRAGPESSPSSIEEVENAIDIEDDNSGRDGTDTFSSGEEVMTTLQPSSSSLTTELITSSSLDDSDLPLCSEVSTQAPQIGLGLISKFSASTTSAPVPCRDAEASETTSSATTEEGEETSTASGSGTLFQQLADKFGSGR